MTTKILGHSRISKCDGSFPRCFRQLVEYRVFADFSEPIFGVGKIPLATMHDPMPVTTA